MVSPIVMLEAVVIAGPTAAGKSQLALDLAARLGGEIVNADAMQVYAPLRVLTARPSAADEAQTPHHLDGIASGSERWSAGRFAREAAPICQAIAERGATPIIVGGTGLWLRALTEGLSPIPAIGEEMISVGTKRLEELGMAAFREEVLTNDPDMAWLNPADTQRHLRAWAVFQKTGQPLSVWQAAPPEPVIPMRVRGVVLSPPREVLYARCDARFEAMMAAGAMEEVSALLALGLDPSLPVMRAVGVGPLTDYLNGALSKEAAIELAQRDTRRLAKRQLTFFKNQLPQWPIIEDVETAAAHLL